MTEANAREIRQIVEQGKQRFQETLGKYAAGDELASTETP